MTPSARSIEFGSVEVGSDSSVTIDLVNTGTAPLYGPAISFLNGAMDLGYSVSGPQVFEAGTVKQVHLHWLPSQAGPLDRVMRIATNDEVEPFADIRLHGTAVPISAVGDQATTVGASGLLAVYPNPSGAYGVVRVSLKRGSNETGQVISLRLLDQLGRLAKVLYRGQLPDEGYAGAFEVTDLAPGVWFLVSSSASRGREVMPLIIER
jgi:hypothetical protein